jgi:tRNA threonylcarbamoyladenosine biosynthesis protein TsaB
MRTIAIDTSHPVGTVVARDGTSVTTRPLGQSGEHARRITAALDEATLARGWRLADAELVIVVRGPGFFTGLRVGVAAAKAIAWASGARLVGSCGFEIIAKETARLGATVAEPIEIAFDAGRGEVYAATATPADSPGSWAIGLGSLFAADAWIASLPPKSLVSGPAVATLVDRFTAAGHRIAPPDAWLPNALAASEVGLAQAAAGSFDDPASLLPHYLRPSYADEGASAAKEH